jgi:ribosomal protein S18 acetylase RimI-like enzyme
VSRELLRLTLPIPRALDKQLEAFDCCGDRQPDDEVAREVRDFLREGGYFAGLEQDITSTYLFLETDESPPQLLGYASLALAVVRLTASEKRSIGEHPFSDFGAIRLVMIGTDVQYQGRGLGYGDELLDTVVGLARKVRETVAVRFLVADANRNLQGWYEGHKFEVNRSDPETKRGGPATVSMRLDLRKREED